MSTNNYIPGVCNIGKDEINKRKRAGIVGLILTVLTHSLFVYFEVSKGVRFLTFIPAVISAIGFLQARMRFCAYYGLAEMFNYDSLGKSNKVNNNEFVRKDKKRARQIIYYSVLIGIGVGLIAAII
ncbi:MAG: hypothetical protein A2499_03765 [Stygiobacter sp. RIFOXYC12_FULL_38_8]|jgi:hypothetical protein|nr:MAG: hypothetical protein A2279_02350 [Stygiobacter sp. RIFOXYA12_FULL_38_9]OGV06910.1 MAG: hypothetical protein A2299_02925 [Stygiobacter sp. RIFOXYB2_FULL_37_11]OGV10512.1 MAG: hypothetical protein A2237_01210 [Stygiobacter sp. RIFOXYA2_FULL_38_8]OGV13377.1 MAG: hypothetical protein A2440_13305 [Stygiobacter sp. RIFOXYC2_FULL_38_25]OGV30317.1 MAG: hypothetical protein A2499_03765 [Stygiobacter sp. RIFOXYC12_FULL_38_8]OGV83423.1 MAG: hypothetical protein A2X65_16860 [Stygiobacter sp. GWF2_